MGKYIIHNGNLYSADELYHYGVKGMKWGVRRSLKKDVKKLRKQYKKKHIALLPITIAMLLILMKLAPRYPV